MNKKKKYKIEFHIHTSVSTDSILHAKLLLIMCKIKKIDCVAITDHNEIYGALRWKKYFEKKGVKVIVGEEIFTKDGEIIGLFLKKRIPPNMSIEKTIKEIKKQNGFVYVPHPYDEKRYKTVLKYELINKNKNDIDFIECYNGRNISSEYGQRQNEIAEKLNIRKIIGSDAHTFYEIGRNYCITNSLEKEKILNEIEKCKFKKSKCIKLCHVSTKFVRLIKIILGGNWNELSRYFNKRFKKNK